MMTMEQWVNAGCPLDTEPVDDNSTGVLNTDKCERCGCTNCMVEFTPDPYQVDMYDNHECYYLCYECREDSRQSI